MDFSYAPADEEFRREIRAWLAANPPARAERIPHDEASLAEEFAFLRDWQRRLHAAGYVGLLWPREYGGRGARPTAQAILNEELARARAPQLLNRVGVNNTGPTLIAHGSEAQKRRLLPPILSRRALVPALQRARRRERPGRAPHARRARRRRLRGERPEGVDELRAVLPLGDPARAHRSVAAQAPRAHLLRPRHGEPGHHDPPAPPADRLDRVQRGLPRRRARAARARDRRGEPGLGDRHDHARPRARHGLRLQGAGAAADRGRGRG